MHFTFTITNAKRFAKFTVILTDELASLMADGRLSGRMFLDDVVER